MAAPDPGLYLITPTILQPTGFLPLLEQALSPGDVACVLLRLHSAYGLDSAAAVELIQEVVRLVQASGAALLVDRQQTLIRRIGADGAHLAGGDPSLRDAIAELKPEYIVGAGNLAMRDDAMVAGECGVDYVMFGEPLNGDQLPPLTITLERVAWWSEIFTVPCVAFAADMEAAATLAATGADFIAFGSLIWRDRRGPAALVAEAHQTLSANAQSPV